MIKLTLNTAMQSFAEPEKLVEYITLKFIFEMLSPRKYEDDAGDGPY